MTSDTIEKINKFSRRPLTEDEVYVFSVILCDNDIDRDCERFSDKALEEIAEKFIGRTGISDHDPSFVNQTARIFDTEVITDESRLTKTGAPYKYVNAHAYMIRTDENRSLIAEIDGGIKKEVSISCSAAKRLCSVCGCDKTSSVCAHTKGKMQNGKLTHTILDTITDAYEWSFVAVPAQVNAGVTKHFSEAECHEGPSAADISAADDELRRDIRKLAFFSGGRSASDAVAASTQHMNTMQLISMKKMLEKKFTKRGVELQLSENDDEKSDNDSEFSMR